MRFAVTGGAGFIGSHISKLLLEKNYDVLVLDNMHTGKKENLHDSDKLEFSEIDVRDHSSLEDHLHDIDGIFHEAGLTLVPESFEKPEEYFDVNVNGTENIFKIAKKLGFKVVYASSSSVYGNIKKIPIKENDSKKKPFLALADSESLNKLWVNNQEDIVSSGLPILILEKNINPFPTAKRIKSFFRIGF